LLCMASTYNDRVAAEVRAEMGRQKLSQMGLAAALGASQAWLSRRLNGTVAFATDELERVAEVLGVPLGQLVSPVAAGAAS